MAKHRRRRRHSYRGLGGIVSIPSLGAFNPKQLISTLNPMGKSVKATDVLLGAAGTAVLGGLVKKQIDKWTGAPAFIKDYESVVIGAVVALGLGFVFKKNKQRSDSLAFGALAGGLLPVIMAKAAELSPFKGMTDVDLGGFLVSDADRALHGFLVSDAMNGLAEAPHMAELAAHAVGEDEDDVVALRSMEPAY